MGERIETEGVLAVDRIAVYGSGEAKRNGIGHTIEKSRHTIEKSSNEIYKCYLQEGDISLSFTTFRSESAHDTHLISPTAEARA